MTSRHLAASVLVALTLAGCGASAEQSSSASPPAASPAASAAPSQSAGLEITGTLGGDGQLEGGCLWIETADGRIEPILPSEYEMTTDPIALLGPDGQPVAEEGDEITVTGRPTPDVMTTCQVGEVWQVNGVAAAAAG